MPALSISRVTPLLAERGLGTTLVEVRFSDNRLIRFRVLSRDPPAVRAIGVELPTHERALEEWLTAHGGRDAA